MCSIRRNRPSHGGNSRYDLVWFNTLLGEYWEDNHLGWFVESNVRNPLALSVQMYG